jgi:hypothetical protein
MAPAKVSSLLAYERPHLPPPAAHAAPRLRHHRDTTTASPWYLRVLQQNLLRPPLPKAAPPTSSTTAARDLAICSEIVPEKRAYIATGNSGYVSASDDEDEDIVRANIAGIDDGDEEVLGTTVTEAYRALIVQRALSATDGQDDNIHRHDLFSMFLIVKDYNVHTIIDGGSCNNLVNVEVVKKLGLATQEHPHLYHIQWVNNSGKVKVTQTRVHFSTGSSHDFVDFDVVTIDACFLLLGHPWEFDTDAIYNGRYNKYTLMHKGKKIVLLPMTPTEIVHFGHEKKTNAKQKVILNSENQQPIKLNTPLLATKCDLD